MTLITVLLATPLAYIMSTVKIKLRRRAANPDSRQLDERAVHRRYAWIMLCGRNGTITNFLLNTFGFKLGDIYGFKGLRHRYEPAALFVGVHVCLRRVQESGYFADRGERESRLLRRAQDLQDRAAADSADAALRR